MSSTSSRLYRTDARRWSRSAVSRRAGRGQNLKSLRVRISAFATAGGWQRSSSVPSLEDGSQHRSALPLGTGLDAICGCCFGVLISSGRRQSRLDALPARCSAHDWAKGNPVNGSALAGQSESMRPAFKFWLLQNEVSRRRVDLDGFVYVSGRFDDAFQRQAFKNAQMFSTRNQMAATEMYPGRPTGPLHILECTYNQAGPSRTDSHSKEKS